MARSAVARATCAAGARRDRLSRESVICSPSLNARSGSFCRLDIGHLTTRHVASLAGLVPNDPLVLQLRFRLTAVVSGCGLGLVSSSPDRPGHDEAGPA